MKITSDWKKSTREIGFTQCLFLKHENKPLVKNKQYSKNYTGKQNIFCVWTTCASIFSDSQLDVIYLGTQQKVLWPGLLTNSLDNQFKHFPLIHRIHALLEVNIIKTLKLYIANQTQWTSYCKSTYAIYLVCTIFGGK